MLRFGMNWLMRHTFLLCVLALPFSAAAAQGLAQRLIGTTAPEWRFTDWMNSEPLALAELRGKVVLVRWWTAPQCPYCRNTAPALNQFHADYASRGLVVVGAYHHKSATPLELGRVRKHAAEFGFEFPVAIDPDWRTLKDWWLDRGETSWTSVTFLLDRKGRIRHIHPGGEYVKGDPEHAALQSEMERLLAE
jgi:peroxiredoxin